MKLRIKYILFIGLIHGISLVMSYFIFEDFKWLFIASEVIVLISLYFSYRLYQSLVNPIELINRGTYAIKERDFTVKFQGVGQKDMDQLIAVYNSMIDELREERTQKAQKHFFLEKLIQNSPTGIIILNLKGEISSYNPIAEAHLGLGSKAILGKKTVEIDHPLMRKISELDAGKTEVVAMNGVETFKCHKAQFIDRGFANYFIMIEELTAEKLEIEKAAYGKVIRMMAHEVNNSIGPINSILESIDTYAKHIPEEDREEYQEILKIAHQRNDKLNDFMVNFAKVVKLPEPILERIDLRILIERMINFMSFQKGIKEIEFHSHLPDQEVWVEVDVKQMEQVMINLIKNAIEAIESKGNIKIELEAEPVILRIEDDGQGISEELAQKVFSPFYSSKKNGQGIGLTLTREILLKHRIHFSLKSAGQKGAVFEMKL
ncbi:MAG: ATP-binding protein [Bacteroidia bacterium]|nr:ATP-binding protein [Bacteroidia bacterium]